MYFTSSIADDIRIPLEIDDVCLVLLQPWRPTAHRSCSNATTIHQNRAVPWTLSTDSSDLPPHLRQPPLPQLLQGPTWWCWSRHGYDKEVVHLLHHLYSTFMSIHYGYSGAMEKHSNRKFSYGTLLFNYSCILLKGMEQKIHLDLLFRILCMKTRPSALVAE